MAALKAGKAAPAFTLSDVQSRSFSLAEQLQHGPVVLAFFKISCPVCQYSLPLLERLHQAYPTASVYGVSQNTAKDTERFIREFGITFPVLLDEAKRYPVSNAYGLTNVPTIFYIAPDGTIEVSSVGWSKPDVVDISRRLGASLDVPQSLLFRPGEQIADFRAG